MLELSTASTEYLRVPISAREAGAPVDPTADTVNLAFTTGGTPGEDDWRAGSWETDPTTDPDTHYARCLIGPAGTGTLAVGQWTIWVRIDDNPEMIVRRVGLLRVT